MTAISIAALGKPISPEMALERMYACKAVNVQAAEEGRWKSLYTVYEGENPTIYVFSGSDGNLVLSADDEVAPLLGYGIKIGEGGDFALAFKSWLNTISDEIAYVRQGKAEARFSRTRAGDFSPIAPLCKTTWSQDEPYYNSCPISKESEDHCYTGCVATAMAQVMKYHKWPEVGEGSISYKWISNNSTLHFNFSENSFDWSNMLDSYADEYTDAEADAVAFLMKSCGYSVEMNYSTSGSGALSQRIAPALGNNFKYDKSKIRYVMRDYCSEDEWETMIYNSLKNYGPVILDGQSNDGGHSFVCDGYDGDGYFHINWGWGGVSDGYFLLSALDPFDQGIGGSGDNSGFNFMQDAIINITPAKGENSSDLWIGQLYSYGEFGIDTSRTYLPGENMGPLCMDGAYNMGPAAIPAESAIGLLMRSEETGKCYIVPGLLDSPCGIMYGFAELELPLPDDIPDGKYRLTLSYHAPIAESDWEEIPDEGWVDVKFPNEFAAAYDVTVKFDEFRFEESSWRPSGMSEPGITVSDGTVRYFNLQGVELKEPLPGQVVIVRQGAKARKILF